MSGGEAPIIGKDALGRPVKDLSVIPWWGVDRKDIEWYPKINYDKCAGCGLCFVTCGRRVFEWDPDNAKPIVARPYNCMVGCSTCAMLCPCDAIEFPDKAYLRRWVARARVVKKAFEIVDSIMPKNHLSEEEIKSTPEG
ncbi:4Fe-4S dicluster domain-containing protein [Thermococcus radiotolerans]|uniref:Ferredoxin n=1 Tax=Thermococcus radiotolerans TaxID=187880 RepID=A0A2Z2MYC4_9EURY|nr:ferredoxin family protein [Thermococcus radiotolerans]ASJ14491.1 ferredoxin [Thermococcus radiotolerans]